MTAAHVVESPKWILPVRALQVVLGVAIMGMSAYGIYWVAFAAFCLALFTSLATFIIVAYSTLTSKIASLHSAYNYWAILALDVFAIIFWLASMADLAATRVSFKYPTTINGCYNEGYGGICYRKRALDKRAVATYGYLDMMSACAGLSALEMLLFVLTLTVHAICLNKHRAAGAPNMPHAAEKGESHVMNGVTYNPVTNQQSQQMPPQQQQFQQPTAYQSPVSAYPQPTQSPAPQQQYGGYQHDASYQPSPIPSLAPQPAQMMQTGYHAPPQGFSEVSAEHGRH